MVNTLGCGALGPGFNPGQQQGFFPFFTKIVVFFVFFASIASSICMLMLDYPLRVDLKKIESGYSKFSMSIPNVQSPRLSRLVWGVCSADYCTLQFEKFVINKISTSVN